MAFSRSNAGPASVLRGVPAREGRLPVQTTQRWTRTENLTVARSGHTATALRDHRILVVGGYDRTANGGTIWDSAELYDAATDAWTPTGGMFYARIGHTATLLPNGQVLVVGGTMNTGVEYYNPRLGEFYVTGRLNASRPSAHAATLLGDGRVLVCGGFDGTIPFPHCFLSSAEIYDPQTYFWKPASEMSVGRYGHTLTTLADGRALVVGGGNGLLGFQSTAEIFDPATGTWSPAGELFTYRFGHTATLLQDGKVIVAGGITYATQPNPHDESLDLVEMFDPVRGEWYSVGRLQVARRYHTAVRLHDGRVLVVGGVEHDLYSGGFVSLTGAELYDPRAFAWTSTGNLNEARSGHSEALIATLPFIPPYRQGSTVIVAGGGRAPHTAERYVVEPRPPVVE
jgi:N-acetylneuraminic acid mutarotase